MKFKIIPEEIDPKNWNENVIACGSNETFCVLIPKHHVHDLEHVEIIKTSNMTAGDLMKAIRGESRKYICLFLRIEKEGEDE